MIADHEAKPLGSSDGPGKLPAMLFEDEWQLRLVWFGWAALAGMGVLCIAVGGKDILTGGATPKGSVLVALLIIAGAWACLAWGALLWLPWHTYDPVRYRFGDSGLAIEYAWPAQSRAREVAWDSLGVVEWHSTSSRRFVAHFHLGVPPRADLDLRGDERLLVALRQHIPAERIVELNPGTGLSK